MERWAVIRGACFSVYCCLIFNTPDRLTPSTLQTDSLRCGQNLRDANEIVGGGGKDKKPLDQLPPAMTGLTQTADGLHPAERFLDPLALLHADGIARMAGRARVDRRVAGFYCFGAPVVQGRVFGSRAR